MFGLVEWNWPRLNQAKDFFRALARLRVLSELPDLGKAHVDSFKICSFIHI